MRTRCTMGFRRSVSGSMYHASLVRLRADSKTDSFKRLYRSRAPVVEGVFAEAKQWHSLGRAWRRGLSKMRVQCLLIAAVINLKRLICLLFSINGLNSWIWGLLERARTILRYLEEIMQINTSTEYEIAKC